MIVTDAFVVSSGMMQPACEALAKHGFEPTFFTESVPDPTTDSVAAALAEWQAAASAGQPPDVIVSYRLTQHVPCPYSPFDSAHGVLIT